MPTIMKNADLAFAACRSIRFAIDNAKRHGGEFNLNDIEAAGRLALLALNDTAATAPARPLPPCQPKAPSSRRSNQSSASETPPKMLLVQPAFSRPSKRSTGKSRSVTADPVRPLKPSRAEIAAFQQSAGGLQPPALIRAGQDFEPPAAAGRETSAAALAPTIGASSSAAESTTARSGLISSAKIIVGTCCPQA